MSPAVEGGATLPGEQTRSATLTNFMADPRQNLEQVHEAMDEGDKVGGGGCSSPDEWVFDLKRSKEKIRSSTYKSSQVKEICVK